MPEGVLLPCRLSVTGSQEIANSWLIGAQTRAASLIAMIPLLPENEANADSFAYNENTRPRLRWIMDINFQKLATAFQYAARNLSHRYWARIWPANQSGKL